MKKVAFCLRGAVSKQKPFFTQGSLYEKGEYVDFIKCRNSIFKYIVDPNKNYQIDFFCHCWNTDLKDKLKEIYKPRKILVEDNNKYKKIINNKCEKPKDFGGISQSLAIKKSVILKEKYELKNNFKYDIVIIYRYDVLLWKNIILDDYNLNQDNIYVNAHVNCNGDFHFIMNNNNSRYFKFLFNSIELSNKYIMHFWIKKFVTQILKKKIIMDKIIPGKHQEVIRKIQDFSIKKGFLSQQMFDTGFDIQTDHQINSRSHLLKNKKKIVILFSGNCNHKWNYNFNYFESFYNSIICPLYEFDIIICIGCYNHEKSLWKEHLEDKLKMKNLTNIQFIYIIDIPNEETLCNETNIFTKNLNRFKNKYKCQYGKLYYTFKYFNKKCIKNNIEIDYFIKCRFDLIYKSDNKFNPMWLEKYSSNNYISVPSTEFHCIDRWSDRENIHTYPNMVCDQFVFGNNITMNKYFNLYNYNLYKDNYNKVIESILSYYLIISKINFAIIELQFSQPGGNYKLGKNDKWLDTKPNYIKLFMNNV